MSQDAGFRHRDRFLVQLATALEARVRALTLSPSVSSPLRAAVLELQEFARELRIVSDPAAPIPFRGRRLETRVSVTLRAVF